MTTPLGSERRDIKDRVSGYEPEGRGCPRYAPEHFVCESLQSRQEEPLRNQGFFAFEG